MHAIYFAGASGVGKTTLSMHVHENYGMPMVSGATKQACQEVMFSHEKDSGNVEMLDAYQGAVWRIQQKLEEAYWLKRESFVSDRCFDLLAYTSRISRSAGSIYQSAGFAEYVQRLRDNTKVIVFFIRPCADVEIPRDGRRDRFLTKDWQFGVDGVIENLLETHSIPFIQLEGWNVKNKIRTIDAVLRIAGITSLSAPAQATIQG